MPNFGASFSSPGLPFSPFVCEMLPKCCRVSEVEGLKKKKKLQCFEELR